METLRESPWLVDGDRVVCVLITISELLVHYCNSLFFGRVLPDTGFKEALVFILLLFSQIVFGSSFPSYVGSLSKPLSSSDCRGLVFTELPYRFTDEIPRRVHCIQLNGKSPETKAMLNQLLTKEGIVALGGYPEEGSGTLDILEGNSIECSGNCNNCRHPLEECVMQSAQAGGCQQTCIRHPW